MFDRDRLDLLHGSIPEKGRLHYSDVTWPSQRLNSPANGRFIY